MSAGNILTWRGELTRVIKDADDIHIDEATPPGLAITVTSCSPGCASAGAAARPHRRSADRTGISPTAVAVVLLQLHRDDSGGGIAIYVFPPAVPRRFESG